MKYALLATAVVACAGSLCSAQTWTVTLDGLSEVPPNASPATGFAILNYNAGTNIFDWDIQWSGLVGTYTASHFHIAPAGTNGPVSIGFAQTGTNAAVGSATPSAAFVSALMANNVYINIHTNTFPGGEIRGQVPTPGAAALFAVAGAAALRRRR
ncbi:MAG: CHRD domain-containing protein [Phycisphaerales bacterium]|nr:CHRD domain-containing protein [Phycisphaerales bacterium]